MKSLILASLVLMSTSAFAGNLIADPQGSIAAEVIGRQIVSKKLLGKDGLTWMKYALEGSSGAPVDADFASIACEPSLGSVDCQMYLKVIDDSRPNGFKDISLDLMVHIYQGEVKSVDVLNGH